MLAQSLLSLILTASHTPDWLRLYQYKKSANKYKSAITAPVFFFSPEGRTNPQAEMQAAVAAFSKTDGQFGIQKQPAACVFPARRRVLERLLNTKFPEVSCPDMKEWIGRVASDRPRMVFVGAYAGNPASILGHTFLQLGGDLLSYSVGFSAHPDGGDNRLMYMLKGLTGGYSGFYEIEPHYMKVGLYGNSESRDLWELPLKLSKDESDLLAMHLWELTFNASIDYYFVDENCSYRLLTWIEAIKPDMDVTRHLSTVVLPAETVRAMLDAELVEQDAKVRASIQRRLQAKLARLSPVARDEFSRARNSVDATQSVADINLLDALLDYWIFENYRAKTRLRPERAAIMEATYRRAAQLKQTPQPLSPAERGEGLLAPFQGHRPHWVESFAGGNDRQWLGGLSYRAGGHPLWSGDPAYAQIAAIEYLGVDLNWRERQDLQWDLLLVRAQALEEGFGELGRMSWLFDGRASNRCELCRSDAATAQILGGAGWSHGFGQSKLYGLGLLQAAAWSESGAQGLLAPGLQVGARFNFYPVTLLIEASHLWWKSWQSDTVEARLAYAISLNGSVFLKSSDKDVGAGFTWFF